MAIPTFETITVLRETALRLTKGAKYNWSHQGSCNCGHLAQTATKLTHNEIHAIAIEGFGEWQDHIRDFPTVVEAEEFVDRSIELCSMTGYTIDHIVKTILDLGFSREDIYHLEKLSNQEILKKIPLSQRRLLQYRKREDVVLYLQTWAAMLEEEFSKSFKLEFSELQYETN